MGVTGVGLRLLFATRAVDASITPPAALVLGGVAAGAIGFAFTPFALAGALPPALGVAMFALTLAILASALALWRLLRRAS